MNYLLSLSQLLIVSLPCLPNHDRAALVRCSCKLCIVVSFEPLVFLLLVDSLRAMTVVPAIHHISADHGVV
jgi:hypothetical protein